VSNSPDRDTVSVYKRLWRYVTPHKGIGLIAVVSMAATAIIEASLVYLLEPLMDDALVAQNLEAACAALRGSLPKPRSAGSGAASSAPYGARHSANT
jgi:ABC-type multidrug transport system fused ATPase/permease subunit